MAVLDTKTKLKAKVVKGNIIYKDNALYYLSTSKFDGENVIVTIEKNNLPISKDLYAFYFGIIIRKECMSSNAFKTYYDEQEIHKMFQSKLRSYIRCVQTPKGTITERIVEDVLQYDTPAFVEYLEDLKWYLESTFGIIIKDYDDYIIHKLRLTK